jgi:hypothetical protein
MRVTSELGRLLAAAREHVRRLRNPDGSSRRLGGEVRVLIWVLEAQHRGVFHVHLVLGYDGAPGLAAAREFTAYLKRHRRRYGFGTGGRGYQCGRHGAYSPADAARMISNYLRPDRVKASVIPLLRAVTDATPRYPYDYDDEDLRGRARSVVRPVYVNRLLTARTGITMRFLRARRWMYRVLRALAADGKVPPTLVDRMLAIVRGIGPSASRASTSRPRPPTPKHPSDDNNADSSSRGRPRRYRSGSS